MIKKDIYFVLYFYSMVIIQSTIIFLIRYFSSYGFLKISKEFIVGIIIGVAFLMSISYFGAKISRILFSIKYWQAQLVVTLVCVLFSSGLYGVDIYLSLIVCISINFSVYLSYLLSM